MNRGFKQKAIGSIGEKILANFCSSQGFRVVWNTEEFGYWDLEIDGVKSQVKTLTPFVKHDAWCISESKTGRNIDNLLKCKTLYIVSIPSIYSHPTDGKIFSLSTSHLSKSDLMLLEGSNNASMVIYRDNPNLIEVYKLNKEEIKSITEHKISYFTKKS